MKMISMVIATMLVMASCGTIPIPPDAVEETIEITSYAVTNDLATGDVLPRRDENFAGMKVYVDGVLVHTEYRPDAPDTDIVFLFALDVSAWALGEIHQVGASCFDGVFNEDGTFAYEVNESETAVEDVVKVQTASGKPGLRVVRP